MKAWRRLDELWVRSSVNANSLLILEGLGVAKLRKVIHDVE